MKYDLVDKPLPRSWDDKPSIIKPMIRDRATNFKEKVDWQYTTIHIVNLVINKLLSNIVISLGGRETPNFVVQWNRNVI